MHKKLVLIALTLFTAFCNATIVEFQTNQGNFRVNLFDNDTPETVNNFLMYATSERYDNVIIHRSAPGFVIQGGGFSISTDTNDEIRIEQIDTLPPIINEPVFSNVRGTIAMAKSSDPNSATSQWFFNLEDNSGAVSNANLDTQNEGFTVFGQVIDDGMDVVDQIAALEVYNFGGTLGQLPLIDYTTEDYADDVTPLEEQFVIIHSVVVIDADPDTAEGLDPVRNTLINEVDEEDDFDTGSFGYALISLLILGTLRRRKFQ
ncbi:peptidylprolyl isomerase [Pleionea sediminis]|uniref:peptidylprolyl isomerase n=1 Tax=Pleionea sediminis TaxID=2569479 RepID=UPI0011850A68|nr:peptidylprolyl isomerase [Pleionea sediminis]